MSDSLWLLGLRIAGAFHFVTLALACFTPIPPNWDENLARLPPIHRRFAVAQNFFIGATIAFFGLVCLFFAPALLDGSTASRLLCAAIALWWGGRLLVLPWLRVGPEIRRPFWVFGFVLLHAECALYAVAFGFLSFR